MSGFSAVFKDILSERQHTYREGLSTTINLLKFTSYVLNQMEMGGQMVALYMDISKVFATLDHQHLLKKLAG